MLPKHIQRSIMDKGTSLGDHPAIPRDEEVPFLLGVAESEYEAASNGIPDWCLDDKRAAAAELDRLMTKCMKLESGQNEALCAICCDVLSEMFDIPDDTIDISVELVARCDMSKFRVTPEPTRDFQFYDADDMAEMSDMVYQRRAIDALVAGAAISLLEDSSPWKDRISSVDPRLPDLYNAIMKLRRFLLFMKDDSISETRKDETGSADVTIPDSGERVGMHAKGVVFPIMLEYAVRGLLEVASIHGLPDDEERAEYILSKADYRLAENWDSRLGPGLWRAICRVMSERGVSVSDVGANFMIMELSSMSPGNFNTFMRNVLGRTVKGYEMAEALGKTIEYNKEADRFNNFVKARNSRYAINDGECYSADELLSEASSCEI